MAKIVIPPAVTKTPNIPPPPIPNAVSKPMYQGKAIQMIMENTRREKARIVVPTSKPRGRVNQEATSSGLKRKTNPIYIIDYDWKPDDPGVREIELPTVPYSIEFDPNPNWAIIASVGRNSPFFHYTGSEDTLTFTIDWYSKVENREDVITSCRWLEAKTKSDGYKGNPHRILLKWGNENTLFDSVLWVVTKASYKLSGFVKTKSMLPQQAFQEVTLKRVADFNLTTKEVYGKFAKFTAMPKAKGI